MRNVASVLSQIRYASIGLGVVESIRGNESIVRTWSYGEIDLCSGQLVRIRARWWPRLGSQWESFQDSYIRALPEDCLRAYYAFPRRAAGFLSVLYAQSGPNTKYRTLLRAVEAMDEIANLRNAQAIVCQMVSQRGTERLMNRWGYVKHAASLGDNHYIKRLK